MNNSVLMSLPFMINDEIVRIYASFRDFVVVGRMGYLDLDAKNLSNILKISSKSVLDIGQAGCFDDNDMMLGDMFICFMSHPTYSASKVLCFFWFGYK